MLALATQPDDPFDRDLGHVADEMDTAIAIDDLPLVEASVGRWYPRAHHQDGQFPTTETGHSSARYHGFASRLEVPMSNKEKVAAVMRHYAHLRRAGEGGTVWATKLTRFTPTAAQASCWIGTAATCGGSGTFRRSASTTSTIG